MKIVNRKTGEILALKDINSVANLIFAEYFADKRADGKLQSFIVPENQDFKNALIEVLWNYLKTLPEWADYTLLSEFKDWPTEESDAECFNLNYRVYLSNEAISNIVSDVRFAGFVNKVYSPISTMRIRPFDGKGKYIYCSRFDDGDAFILKTFFAAEFDLNPYKEGLEAINFEPTPEILALLSPPTQEPIIEEGE